MERKIKTVLTIYAISMAAFIFAPKISFAEEKFLPRDPQASSYSALCAFYRQEDLPPAGGNAVRPGFADFRACDLSRFDLSAYTPEEYSNFSFDSSTVWPEKKKMPKGFKPEKIMKQSSKTYGQIQNIRKEAEAGKGYAIGIIGKPPLLTHKEYSTIQPIYRQYALSPLANRESTAALALLAGKNGMLPESAIYFTAPQSYGKIYGARDMYPEAKALRDMFIFSREQLPEGRKIKAAVLLYRDYPLATDGMVTMGKAKKDAKEQGAAIFSGDDIQEFKDYNIIPDKLIRAASAASDNAYAIIPPSPEMQAAWLAGLYIAAANIYPELTKEEFFWMLKKTALISPEDAKQYKILLKKSKKAAKKTRKNKNVIKNNNLTAENAAKMPEMPKKTLQPLKMLKILREMGKN